VGTDNESLQNLDLYMGLHQPRITDQELYRDIMDEVRAAPKPMAQTDDQGDWRARCTRGSYKYMPVSADTVSQTSADAQMNEETRRQNICSGWGTVVLSMP
jgi:hypothetical protein